MPQGKTQGEIGMSKEGSPNTARVRACVLIRVRPGHHHDVAKRIASLEGVKDAFAVMGAADVVASIHVADMKALAALGTKIGDLADIVTTETLVAAEV